MVKINFNSYIFTTTLLLGFRCCLLFTAFGALFGCGRIFQAIERRLKMKKIGIHLIRILLI